MVGEGVVPEVELYARGIQLMKLPLVPTTAGHIAVYIVLVVVVQHEPTSHNDKNYSYQNSSNHRAE